jgi:hypothetical protein
MFILFRVPLAGGYDWQTQDGQMQSVILCRVLERRFCHEQALPKLLQLVQRADALQPFDACCVLWRVFEVEDRVPAEGLATSHVERRIVDEIH